MTQLKLGYEVLDQMPHKKLNLPSKTCVACHRPFVWRKKWEKVWEQVKYCSEACKNKKCEG